MNIKRTIFTDILPHVAQKWLEEQVAELEPRWARSAAGGKDRVAVATQKQENIDKQPRGSLVLI